MCVFLSRNMTINDLTVSLLINLVSVLHCTLIPANQIPQILIYYLWKLIGEIYFY